MKRFVCLGKPFLSLGLLTVENNEIYPFHFNPTFGFVYS